MSGEEDEGTAVPDDDVERRGEGVVTRGLPDGGDDAVAVTVP